jgi:hypothetical protein
MYKIGPLALTIMLASGSAFAEQAAQPPAAVPHAQPRQQELQQLPSAERAQLGVDLSSRGADVVDELYRQVLRDSEPGRSAGPNRDGIEHGSLITVAPNR